MAEARRSVQQKIPEIETLATVEGAGEAPSREPGGGEADPARLRIALDTLDEKIKLLLVRHASLAERYAAAVAARREVEEQLARLTEGGIDPAALEERVAELEALNGRLARHAAYLEDRIEGLLARVRYVVES